MQIFRAQLENKLKGARKIAIVGIGSELRADDACGVLIAQAIKRHLFSRAQVKVFIGATAPENITGEIKKFKPTHTIMIDAAQIDKPGAEVALFTLEEATDISFCTHRLPLSVMAKYLQRSFPCEVLLVGIQPKSLVFNKPVSPEIKKTIKCVSGIIIEIMENCYNRNKYKKEKYA